MKGFFITLEGIDGSGKSTLASGLVKMLEGRGVSTLLTRAPGGTDAGLKIRELILHGHLKSIKAELLLFLADRAEHVEEVIKPALDAGKVVICDRFSDSTIAYQSARGLNASKVQSLCDYATSSLVPDLTLLVDIDPKMAYDRIEKVRHKDRIENEGLYLMTQIAEQYKILARAENRIKVLDGSVSISELLQSGLDHVEKLIHSKRL